MTHGHFRGCLPFSFAELTKPAIIIFFRNLHLLSFAAIYSLPCFPLKWRAYEFFPRGHPRKFGVTLRANVTNGQTFGGNRSKINSAHILMLGRP